MNVFIEVPDEKGPSQFFQHLQLPDDGQVVLEPLAEADAGIDDDLSSSSIPRSFAKAILSTKNALISPVTS